MTSSPRRRDYRAEYAQRTARAKAAGYRSYADQRRSEARSSVDDAEPRRRALDAVGYMRRKNVSLAKAARLANTTPATVTRYAGSALERRGRTWTVRGTDRLRRRMAVLTTTGIENVTVTSSAKATLVGNHWSAVRRYLRTGDDTDLQVFGGVTVGGHYLETDLDTIDVWARAGEADLDDIYSTLPS